jgi:hypothetical protein
MTATSFANLQATPGWSGVTGSDIAPSVPSQLELSQFTDSYATALMIDTTGVPGQYAGGEVRSANIPIPPNTGNAKTRFIFAVSETYPENCQSLEFGVMGTTPDGEKLNGAIQLDNSASPTLAALDVTAKDHSWAPTGWTLPKFGPGLHVLDIVHNIDMSAKTISVVSVEIDGALFDTPADLEGVPAQALVPLWEENIFFTEMQVNTNQKGGNWQVWVLFVGVTFW